MHHTWLTAYSNIMISCCVLLQMMPLLKRTTDSLVEVIGEKATADNSFDALK